MRLWVCFLSIVFCPGAAKSAEVLRDFQPSAIRSEYGVASDVEFSTGLIELESGALAFHLPLAMKSFTFAERVWLIGYRTDIMDAQGKSPRENYLCHTFFGDQRVVQEQDQELKGIYSDAFTPEVRLPDGFGIPVSGDELLNWMPMFNNRGETAVRVAMKVTLTVIRAKDMKKSLTPLYANLRSVETPHLYFVPPGKDRRQVTFALPFRGAIHFLGTHVHPYGVSIELYNVSRQEQVWIGTRTDLRSGPMQVYSNPRGYPVRAGETYRITAVYENPNDEKIDAMAGLFMLYSRN